jgi:hypothetical protein
MRLLGVETEYALTATDARGVPVEPLQFLDGLMRHARRRLVHLPDELGRGMFLASGGRLYVDCGGHLELTTPECADPWQLLREVRAGERTMLQLANGWSARRANGRLLVLRSNVDLSGSQATWGMHENYGHRAGPDVLAKQIVPHLVSRVVFTGAGGFDNVSHGIDFTLSPRTPHLTREISRDSTANRGIFHDKSESLARGYGRLHLLCGESLCSDLAVWLRTGTTALVVTLAENGCRPGAAVALRDPVGAMRRFASDPTCRATAETTRGVPRSAVDIQHHYLSLAEAHVGAPFMPHWAADVCREWRAVLARLEHGWEAVATSLDWAIKLGLYRDHARRRGVDWETLRAWSPIVAALGAALTRQRRRDALTSALVLGAGSPLADEVARLTPIVATMGRSWRELEAILHLRHELFELDTRFAQLGEGGVFARLDAAGVLAHAVAPAETKASVPRAALRAALVRELAGNGRRYACSWVGVWDTEAARFVDLGDPFDVRLDWKQWRSSDDSMPPEAFLRARERRALPSNPVALNNRALELRQHDQLPQAERMLRRAMAIEDDQIPADSPRRPHRRNNLALVLLRTDKLGEARVVNADAWALQTGRHDVTSGRILFTRIALDLLIGSRAVAPYVGQLKTLLAPARLACAGDITPTWDIPDVLETLDERLLAEDAHFLTDVAAVLNAPHRVAMLEPHWLWAETPAVPLEQPWPPAARRD